MAPTFSSEDSELISKLNVLANKGGKLVKSSVYSAPGAPQIIVRSWKMNEFKYYDIPSPFPTLARGLFTVQLPAEEYSEDVRYRIVARGYDKFFNIGEVPWTNWPSLEAHTAAPYVLSLKSNGCIIFIAAITPEKLLITSKHSLGPVENVPMSHAQAGEMWIRRYLERKGRKEEDLAKILWDNNWTAVAELCDDSFEEHVLAYPPEKTGLHLHGLNMSSKAFQTLPHDIVDAFADEWGFIKTRTHTVNSIAEVRAFTDAIAEAGEWEGESVEGFVVRTHVTEPPTEEIKKSVKDVNLSPYPPGSSFFFKIKFDEPYMMYRDWREVTKMLLKGPLKASSLPKNKMKRPETKLYVNWVIREIEQNPDAFKEYAKGKGIINTREKFLEWMESKDGKAEWEDIKEGVEETEERGTEKWEKTIIIPVAIPGCGKTAVSVALREIFGFGHTQSDDVHVKKSAPVFIKNVQALLHKHDVVIADKNNHLRQHRQALKDVAYKFKPPARLLALNWALDKPPAAIHRICGDRVLSRGENHQSLRADPQAKSHEDVIWMFIQTREELADAEVDESIEMQLEEGLEEAVRRSVDGCVRILGLEKPSEEKIKKALEVATSYEPTTKKPDDTKVKKAQSVRYYALLPEVDLVDMLDARVEKEDEGLKNLWTELKKNKRVTNRPHMTLVHSKSLPGEQELWERCAGLHQMASPPLLKGKLGSLVWNDRVMAVTIEELEVDETATEGQEGQEFVSKLPFEVRERLHITVCTLGADIAPIEAMELVQAWKKGEKVSNIKLDPVVVKGRVKGITA